MKFSTVASLFTLAVSGVQADKSEEINFLTALVDDYNDHKKEYLNFAKTAKDAPPDLTKLALQVKTYTDDSYTTLINNDDIHVLSLMDFATELPWYSRLDKDAPASSGGGSSKSSSKGSLSSSSGGVGSVVAPVGAVLGAAALILM